MSRKPKGLVGGGKRGGKKSSQLTWLGGAALLVGIVYVGSIFYAKSQGPTPAGRPTRENTARHPKPPKSAASREERRGRKASAAPEAEGTAKHANLEWTSLPRNMDECLASQDELMSLSVPWPGFHALCIAAVEERPGSPGVASVTVSLHHRSGAPGQPGGTRTLHAVGDGQEALDKLIAALQDELLEYEFQQVDPMVSTSAYDHVPNPWHLFTQRGGPVTSDADLLALGRGGALWLYTGGAFIWPGVRIGHKTRVPIPVTDGSSGGYKEVEMETRSLRPLVLELSGFLTEAECAFIRNYASTRMVPSGLAMMDSSGSEKDVRTSTQTFMERNGSPQIRALEERAHNLTRLSYELGENIQVVRYEKGQKYGAHRDFFNPNDYHRQPAMLRSVEYGARNRLATVFWYLETVTEGGETFFPRALNEQGQEYHRWNGDHEDCYRGLYVPPVRGNAVLFYSMVPDGRLDERSLHGGCKPRREGAEKWGANQWIWNHPQRRTHAGVAPRRLSSTAKARQRAAASSGCVDEEDNCEEWARLGECAKNAVFMEQSCRLSCGKC